MIAPCKAASRKRTAYSKCIPGHLVCLLLPLWQCSHAAAETPAGPDEPAIYVDRLIEPDVAEQDFDPVYRDYLEQPAGRRYLRAELLHYREARGAAGVSSESGARLLYRRETLEFGELEMEAALLGVDSAAGRTSDPGTGLLLTLRQRDYAINNDWVMRNSAGIDRLRAGSTLANSFRFKLPSSIISGVNSRLASDHSEINFGFGRFGRLDSGQLQTFETTRGELLSAGYSRELGERLFAGVQLVKVSDATAVPDHRSVAGVFQYRDEKLKRRYQAHFMTDSEGAGGLWLDGDSMHGRWRHRYGLFYLQPDLLWTDTAMVSDQQGFYTRVEKRTLRYHITGGAELNITDVEDRANVNGTRNITAFVSGGRSLRRHTSIGATLNLKDAVSTENIAAGDSRNISLNGYLTHRSGMGTTRLQVQGAAIRNGNANGHGSGITWDQSWKPGGYLSLSSTLTYEQERGTGNDETRTTAGLLAYHDVNPVLRWDANLNWTRTEDELTGSGTDTLNASLALLWRFLPGWEAILRARVNDATDTSGTVMSDLAGRERTLLLSVRYNRAGGRAFNSFGEDTGKTGFGTVEGMVFFDDNRDGVRQPGEALAAGTPVYLDRRYRQTTDRDGRFEFAPVPAGEHAVSIALEDVPLPWLLDDETPRKVTVNVRGRATVLFPLVRFDE